jgi:hypothetical protein
MRELQKNTTLEKEKKTGFFTVAGKWKEQRLCPPHREKKDHQDGKGGSIMNVLVDGHWSLFLYFSSMHGNVQGGKLC